MHRVGEQLVDLAGALVGAGVGHEVADFLRRRQRADGVDGNPAQELVVAGEIAGNDVEPLQFGENLMVDVVDFGHFRVMEIRRGFHRRQDAHGHHIAAVDDDDGRVAGPQRLDLAERIDLYHGVVVGAEIAKGRDVFLRPVAEGRLDAELPAQAGLGKRVFRRVDGDGSDVAAALAPFGPLHDPFPQQLVDPGSLGESDLAAVGHLAGRLEKQQAGVRVGAVDAPAFHVAGECKVILFGVVAEQREAQAALALEGAVTRTGIAPHAAQQAHDVPLEIDFLHGPAAGQLDVGMSGGGGQA